MFKSLEELKEYLNAHPGQRHIYLQDLDWLVALDLKSSEFDAIHSIATVNCPNLADVHLNKHCNRYLAQNCPNFSGLGELTEGLKDLSYIKCPKAMNLPKSHNLESLSLINADGSLELPEIWPQTMRLIVLSRLAGLKALPASLPTVISELHLIGYAGELPQKWTSRIEYLVLDDYAGPSNVPKPLPEGLRRLGLRNWKGQPGVLEVPKDLEWVRLNGSPGITRVINGDYVASCTGAGDDWTVIRPAQKCLDICM